MHKSRLGGFSIDCKSDDLDEAAKFWSAALGLAVRPSRNPDDAGYVILATAPDELSLEVQKVDHPSRVHLDIEANDIEAEVKRLEKLGAKRVAWVKRWWVMEAPTGQRFCVVQSRGGEFEAKANIWR